MKLIDFDAVLKNQKVILTINIFLGLLLLAETLFFIRDGISILASPKERDIKVGRKSQGIISRSLLDYAPILRNNPFGFPAGELKPLSVSSGPSAVSQADLSLVGTVAGRRELSYAIFADKTGQQDVFRVGDMVFGLGKLIRVEKDKVLINRNGTRIKIPLVDITVVKEIKASGTPQTEFGKKTGEYTYQIDQQRVRQAIEKPDQIMTDARFVPNFSDGRQQGFVLRELKPGGIYQSLGLQNGDVLLRINEYAISNPETALQAFTALRGTDRVQLDIIRNGSKMTMTYLIR
jgi:general secretion pathway protein C